MVVGKHKAETRVGGVRRLLSDDQWRKGEFVKDDEGGKAYGGGERMTARREVIGLWWFVEELLVVFKRKS